MTSPSTTQWTETKPGIYKVSWAGLESFFMLTCAPDPATGREHWTVGLDVALDTVSLPAGLALESRLREAWLTLRCEHPGLGVTLDYDSKTKVYTVLDEAGANAWVDETFKTHSSSVTLESLTANFQSNPLPLLHYLPHTSEIMIQASHWRIDGCGILMLMKRFLELVVSPSQTKPRAWGTEASNLIPAIEEAFALPDKESDFAIQYAEDRLREFQTNFPTTGLAYKGDAHTPPQGTCKTAIVFDKESSTRFLEACKSRQMSVVAACKAATALATCDMEPVPLKGFAWASMLSLDLRRHCPPPLNSARYAVGDFVAGHYLFLQKEDMITFEQVARNLDMQIRQKFVPSEYFEALRAICRILMPLFTTPPPADMPPSSSTSVSNLGRLEDYVPRTFSGSSRDGDIKIRVRDIHLGVEMATRQIGIHMWSWRDKVHMSASHNEAYHDRDHVRRFLDLVVGYLAEGLGIKVVLEG